MLWKFNVTDGCLPQSREVFRSMQYVHNGAISGKTFSFSRFVLHLDATIGAVRQPCMHSQLHRFPACRAKRTISPRRFVGWSRWFGQHFDGIRRNVRGPARFAIEDSGRHGSAAAAVLLSVRLEELRIRELPRPPKPRLVENALARKEGNRGERRFRSEKVTTQVIFRAFP